MFLKNDLVLRNPAYFFLLFLCAVGAYITYHLNLWHPIVKMTEAASHQAVEEVKRRLRDFLESSDTGRQSIAVSGGKGRVDESELSGVNDDKLPNRTVNRNRDAESDDDL